MNTAILDIPEVRERVQRWSVKEYERRVEEGVFGKKHELIRGLVIEKMSKSPLPLSISKRLYDFFLIRLPDGYSVRHEGPLRFADSLPEADVAIVRGGSDDFMHQHPATAILVIEVAVSSAALDRENASLFAEAGVEDYWIVLLRDRKIEVYRRPESGTYRDVKIVSEGSIECAGIPGMCVVLADIFG